MTDTHLRQEAPYPDVLASLVDRLGYHRGEVQG